MPTRRPIAVLAGLVALLAAGIGAFALAPPASAATPPLAPPSVTLQADATSVHVGWTFRYDGNPMTAVVVTRTGVSADGVLTLTRTIASTYAQPAYDTTFGGLVPGGRYSFAVAFVNGSGTGPSVTRSATLSAAGIPTLIDASFAIYTAPVLHARSYDDIYCSLYHFFNQQCGQFAVSIRTTGYAATTTAGWWSLTAKVSRSFGCLRTGSTEYRPRSTITRRIGTSQYGWWDYEPVRVAADGTSTNTLPHDFGNPPSFAGTDDMPHFRCPAGWDVAQAAGTVSDAVALLHGGEPETDGPILGVLYVTGSASSGPAPWA